MVSFDIWDGFTQFMTYSINAYSSMQPYVYPIIIFGILGWIFAYMRSVVVFIVAGLITLAMFVGTTAIFTQVSAITLFLYIITIVGIPLLIVSVILAIQKRGGY